MSNRFNDYFTAHRDELDALIFDVDGTLINGGVPIPESMDFICRLQRENFPYFLLTNDAGNSPEQKAEIIRQSGIPAAASQIISSGNAIAEYIQDNNWAGRKFYQCGDLGIPNYAESAALLITRDPRDIYECEGAIVGEGVFDWRREINGLFNFILHHPGAPVLVGNPDSYWKGRYGVGVGSGAIIRMVASLVREAGGDVDITYIGKPYPPVYEYVKKHLKEMLPECSDPQMSKIAMIGDSLASDIQGANYAGMISCLVLTGVTTRELAGQAPLHRKPDMIFDTL